MFVSVGGWVGKDDFGGHNSAVTCMVGVSVTVNCAVLKAKLGAPEASRHVGAFSSNQWI